MTSRAVIGLVIASCAWAAPVAAQPNPGVAITPFVGLTVPHRDLLLRPGQTAGTDQERQTLFGLIGARVTVGLPAKFQLEGDVGYGSSGLQVSTLSAPSGTDASVLMLSGRIGYRFKSVLEPFWFTAHLGVASVKRSFSERNNQPQSIADQTSVGAVAGGSFVFRMSARAALVVGIEEYIYNASFDVPASGSQPAGTTQSLTQNDLRVTIGVRVPLIGF